jgi:1-phosphatidylinositol-4-phosphate 5-kinase
MLKTISRTEFRFFKKILKNYYYHMENNDSTLVTRIYGLHKMIFFGKKRKSEKTLYFTIMNNIFHTSKEIHKRYDLKGSTQGRTTKYSNNVFDPTIALKDNDIINEEEYIIVAPDMAEKLREQIRIDMIFFKNNNIIDYSLLIGIHDKYANPNTGKYYVSQKSLLSESDTPCQTVRDYAHIASLPFHEQEEGGI